MNPALFTDFYNNDENKVLLYDSFKARERNENDISPRYQSTTPLLSFSNSVCTLFINPLSLDVFKSDTGNPQSYYTVSNSNLKRLYFSRRQNLPQSFDDGYEKYKVKISALDEFGYSNFNGQFDTYDTLHRQNKCYITVIDNKFCVYMPPWYTNGKVEGDASTWRFTSIDGVNWIEEQFTVNSVTPSTDTPPMNISDYDSSLGVTLKNLKINKPVISWFIKKLNGVFFLWMSLNSEWNSGYSSGVYSYTNVYWVKCWTSVDGLTFTKINIPNNINGIIRGPWGEETIGYANGYLYFLSDPFSSSTSTKASHFYYSNDMGQTWNIKEIQISATVSGYASPIAVIGRNNFPKYNGTTFDYVPGFLILTTEAAYLMYMNNGVLDTTQVSQIAYYASSYGQPAAQVKFVTSFHDARIIDNIGVVTQSGSSMYFISIPDGSGWDASIIKCATMSGGEVIGLSKNNTYVYTSVYSSGMGMYGYSINNLVSSAANYANPTAYYEASVANNSNINFGSSINNCYYNVYNGKYTLISNKSIRQTTDFETITIRPGYDVGANTINLGNSGGSIQTIMVNELNGYQYYIDMNWGYIYKSVDDWNTYVKITASNPFTQNYVSNSYTYLPKCYVFDSTTSNFLTIVNSYSNKITFFKENSGVITGNVITFPTGVYVSKLTKLGNNIYALAGPSQYGTPSTQPNGVYKLTYNSQTSSYDYTLIYSSDISVEKIGAILPYNNPNDASSKKLILFGTTVNASSVTTGVLIYLNEDSTYTRNVLSLGNISTISSFLGEPDSQYNTTRYHGAIDYSSNTLYYDKFKIDLDSFICNTYITTSVSPLSSPVGQYYIPSTDNFVNILQYAGTPILEYRKLYENKTSGQYSRDVTCVKFEPTSAELGTMTTYWNNQIIRIDKDVIYPSDGIGTINQATIIYDPIISAYYTVTGLVETVGTTLYYSIDKTKTFI